MGPISFTKYNFISDATGIIWVISGVGLLRHGTDLLILCFINYYMSRGYFSIPVGLWFII